MKRPHFPAILTGLVLGMLAGGLSSGDGLRRAWERLKTKGDLAEASGQRSRQQGYKVWSQKDPVAAAAWLKAHGSRIEHKHYGCMVAENLMRRDPAAALALLHSLRPGNSEEFLRTEESILEKLAEHDPGAAITAVESCKDPERKTLLQFKVLMTPARDHPQEAKDYLTEIKDPAWRQQCVSGMANNFALNDPAGAAKWYLEESNGENMDARPSYMILFRLYTLHAPEEAFAWSMKLKKTDRLKGTRFVLGLWAVMDTPAALTAVASIPDVEGRREITLNLAHGWAERVPEYALEWAKSLEGAVRTEALREVFFGSLSLHRTAASRKAAREWLRDPAAASDTTDRVISGILYVHTGYFKQNELSRLTPEEALEEIRALPPGRVREEVLRGRFLDWHQFDAPAADRWLRDQPLGLEREMLSEASEAQSLMKYPSHDFREALGIWNQPERRMCRVEEVLRIWESISPAAAQRGVQESTLSPAEKASLLKILKQ